MAAQIWWKTCASSLRFSCSCCARTLHFNRSNKWLIGFKSRLFAGHLRFCSMFAISITSVFLALPNIIPRLAWIRIRKTTRRTSFWYRIVVMFPWIVTLVFVGIKTLEYRRGISDQIWQLPCVHKEPEHITYFSPTVPHGQFCTYFFFLLIDRLVCTRQSNQTLAALIKYVAWYYIL